MSNEKECSNILAKARQRKTGADPQADEFYGVKRPAAQPAKQQAQAARGGPTAADIARLRQNPSAKMKALFAQEFGQDALNNAM